MKNAFLIFLFFLLLPCNLSGNEIFKQLTIENGLAHSDANSIVQDSSGLIWIGTRAGLQSYDGYELQTFDYYPPEQKVYQSHNRIRSIIHLDNRLWLGTESGLTCFDLDTHRYISYHAAGKMQEYTHSDITKVFADASSHQLWIKTSKGLTASVVKNDTIYPLEWENEADRNFCKNIRHMHFSKNAIWISGSRRIVQLVVNNGKIKIQSSYKANALLNKQERIQATTLIGDFLYIRSQAGCYRVSVSNGKLHKRSMVYINFHDINPQIPAFTTGPFTVEDNGILWCGYAEGIFQVEYPFTENPSIRTYLKNNKQSALSAQKIRELFIDKYQNLWITTESQGVYYRKLAKSSFKNISQELFSEMGFSQNEIVSVTGQEDGTIWLIVEYASLFHYNPQTEELTLHPLPKNEQGVSYYQTIEASKDQRYLYIGSNKGLFVYDIPNKKLRSTQITSPSTGATTTYNIADLLEDSWGRLWIASWQDGLICIADPLTTPTVSLQLTTQTQPAILSDLVNHLLIHKQSLLACTTNGLNRILLDAEGNVKHVSSYQADKDKNASMSSNYLANIGCGNDSTYWIGTIGGGVNKLVLHSDKDNDYTATCYTTRDGLTSNDCEIILMDKNGNAWVGGNGLMQIDTQENRIYTYGTASGLQNNAFKINVSCQAEDGTLFMGGLYGLSYFQPLQLDHHSSSNGLMFTNLYVNNRLIIPGETYDGRKVLDNIIDKTHTLTLNYRQNNFSISVSALGYDLSDQIMYRYRLKTPSSNWQTLKYTNNDIFFTNLPYGNYTLEVQLSTDKGYTWQDDGKTLDIRLLPPWWLSGWAKGTYAICLVGLIFIAFRHYEKEQKLKKENEIQKILMRQDEERYQQKMQFFMNASHELKTPLTLILLAAEKLDKDTPAEKENCNTILSNTKKMLALISELVDIRKTDLGIGKLEQVHFDLSRLTRQLYEDIAPWAKAKNIAITYQTDEHPIYTDGDLKKIGKMEINLFSNAIKYTNSGGCIEISLRQGCLKDITPSYGSVHKEGDIPPETPACILSVKDTGIGISTESIRQIYERFFQVNENKHAHLGTGIGLAIVKSIVLQHQGTILVSSQRGTGTEFIVLLPMRDDLPQATHEPTFNLEQFLNEEYSEYTPQNSASTPSATSEGTSPDLPTLLIVEDNKELQQFLKQELTPFYNIYVEDNGQSGLDTCMAIFPDIIITDVMMPQMDGIEMCRHIRNNLSVAAIPIVMLTAKGNVESQIEGYESGADLYMAKPFSMKLLKAGMKRLLEQKEQWLKKAATLSPGDNTAARSKATEPSDPTQAARQKLMQFIQKTVEEHISDPEFSSDQLASAMNVSRSKLYKDIRELADGFSLSDYVRNVRLEKAAELLVTTRLNVQEIMMETGFINSSHFTKAFKTKFGVPPTEYKKTH